LNYKDLSVLSELPFLLSLNVSQNKIEKLFDFLPPYNLKEASFSFNSINEIGNLSNFHYLQTLELNSRKNNAIIFKALNIVYYLIILFLF
jgi:Leucine-rich repeat (LRR) protein